MISGTYYLDSNGYPRAEFEPPHELLSWYLSDDVQSPQTCDLFLSVCQNIKSRECEQWEGTGNAHTVTITAEGVHVENEFSDFYPPCDLSIDDFIDVLSRWKYLIDI